MSKQEKVILEKIEIHRKKLYKLANKTTLNTKCMIYLSEALDDLLNEYDRIRKMKV